MHLQLPLLLVAALLAGCASTDSKQQEPVQKAIITPLNDLNLVNAPIPPVLVEVQKAPYALKDGITCDELTEGVRALDEVLGADLDTLATDADPGLVERGGALVNGAVQHAAEGLIPYRGWVRKISGAERYSKQVAAAIAAGTVRRAFLKGVARAKACEGARSGA
jgi:hypothetical protein